HGGLLLARRRDTCAQPPSGGLRPYPPRVDLVRHAIATPAGAIAELPLEGAGLRLVSFGAVAEAAAAVLSDELREGLAEGRRQIAVAYPRERFIDGWER